MNANKVEKLVLQHIKDVLCTTEVNHADRFIDDLSCTEYEFYGIIAELEHEFSIDLTGFQQNNVPTVQSLIDIVTEMHHVKLN